MEEKKPSAPTPPPIPLPEPKGTSLGELTRVARGTMNTAPFLRESDLPSSRSGIAFLNADPVVSIALPPLEGKSAAERAIPVLLAIAFLLAGACVVGVAFLLLRGPAMPAVQAAAPPATPSPAAQPPKAPTPVAVAPTQEPRTASVMTSMAKLTKTMNQAAATLNAIQPAPVAASATIAPASLAVPRTPAPRSAAVAVSAAIAPASPPVRRKTPAARSAPAPKSVSSAAPASPSRSPIEATIDDVVEPGAAPAPAVRTRVSNDEIEPSMKIKRDEIKRCAATHGVSGLVKINFSVASTGRVANVKIPGVASTPFVECVAAEVRQLGFRPFDGPANSFVYPIMVSN